MLNSSYVDQDVHLNIFLMVIHFNKFVEMQFVVHDHSLHHKSPGYLFRACSEFFGDE